ncbi:WD40 repeat domain-containing protein [Streptomyces sp. NPDC007905]|uniref:WD40 repeat domain-containing protein n=1 Tax=Streptomyces sp. NPDC007905 TaxID=3364788 RepID=UPI0036E751B0
MPEANDGRHAEIHRQIATALADLVPGDPTIPPHPYLRRHLAEHAAEGHVLDDEHVPPALLAWESSSEVRRLLAADRASHERRQWLHAWAALEPFARGVDPVSRLSSLRLARYASALPSPSRAEPAPPAPFSAAPVTPLWSDYARPTPAWTASPSKVTSLATVENAEGQATAIAAGDDVGTLRILRLDGRLAHVPINVHSGAISHLMALKGGLVITAGTDGCVAAVNAVNGKLVREVVVRRKRTWVSSLTSYQPPGQLPLLLAAFSDGDISAFDVGRFMLHPVPLPELQDRSALLCGIEMPDGSCRLLFTQHDTVYCFDGQTASVHSRHAKRIRSVLAMPWPGQYAVADESGTVSLCDLSAADAVSALGHHAEPVTALLRTSYERKPALVSAAGDGTLRLWRLPGLNPVDGVLPAHTAPVTAMTCVSGGEQDRLLSGGADRLVRSWDVDQQTFGQPPKAWNFVTASALSASPPHLLAAARASRVIVKDLTANRQRTLLKGRKITALAWPRVRGQLLLAAALDDNRIICVDPGTGRHTGTVLAGHILPVRALVNLPTAGGELLASGGRDGKVCVWQPATGRLVAEFRDHSFTVRCLATFQGAGSYFLASGGSDGNVRVWDADSLMQYGPTIKCDQDIINDLAFVASDHDGLLIASAGQDGTLKLWDVATARTVRELACNDGELGAVTALRLPLERTALAAAGKTSIHLWDATTDRPLLQIVTGSPIRSLKTVQDPHDAASSIMLASGEAGTMAFRLQHDRL